MPTEISLLLESINTFFEELFKKEIQVVSIIPIDNGWNVEFEVIAEEEYMKNRGRKALIERYEAKVNKNFYVVSYERKLLKERGSLE